ARYFSASENRRLDACPPLEYAARFVEIWTLKESYIKALGTGLNHPLDSFSFELDGESGIQFDPPRDAKPARWHFALTTPAPGYRLALAVYCPGDERFRITLHDANGPHDIVRAPARESPA